MRSNRVVVKMKNGELVKGIIFDFSPRKNYLHIETEDNRDIEIDVEKIKAAFFVKKYSGNRKHSDLYFDDIPGGGELIRVTFKDGEIISGYTNSYSPESPVFVMTAADRRSNNDRIFIVRSATSEIIRPHLTA